MKQSPCHRSGQGKGMGLDFWLHLKKVLSREIRCLPLLQVTFRKRSGTTWHDCLGLTVTMRSLALNRLEVFVGNDCLLLSVSAIGSFLGPRLHLTPQKNKLNEFRFLVSLELRRIGSSIEKGKKINTSLLQVFFKNILPFQAVEWFTLSACSKGDMAREAVSRVSWVLNGTNSRL